MGEGAAERARIDHVGLRRARSVPRVRSDGALIERKRGSPSTSSHTPNESVSVDTPDTFASSAPS